MKTATKSRKKIATVTLPFRAIKYLYKTARGRKIVCEIDIALLRTVNESRTVDEMIAEAQFEYATGETKGFTDTKKMIAFLNK